MIFASDAPFDPEGGPMYIREAAGGWRLPPVTIRRMRRTRVVLIGAGFIADIHAE